MTAFTLERSLTYRLHQLHKWSDAQSQRVYLSDTGLPMSEARCLTAVGSFAPLSVNQLASQANLNKAQASRAAQALVARGLVSKVGSSSDKRGVVLALTKAGQASWQAAMAVVAQRNRDIFACLSDGEKTTLSAMFDRLIEQAIKDKSVGTTPLKKP
jgi:DNA-binding MarR family transcriptional regulator